MQQRRLRLGDILDDYCPRERRITNHAVVAMIDVEIRQTRCTTCDAEHEYKQARVPPSRRKKTGESAADLLPPALSSPMADESIETPDDGAVEETASLFAESPDEAAGLTSEPADLELSGVDDDAMAPGEDEGPVHRPLIRATLPRPEGQTPERKAPDFTVRQPGGRSDQQRNNQRNRGRQQTRHAGQSFGSSSRGNGPRQGNGRPGGDAQQQRNGNRSGNSAGQRGGGRPFGSERGPRSGGGHGRKRGR